MQKWIGTYKQGAITGLFNSSRHKQLTAHQQQSLELKEGDLVTVTELKSGAPATASDTAVELQTITNGTIEPLDSLPDTSANETDAIETGTNGADAEVTRLARAGSPESSVYQVLAEKGLDPDHPCRCEQEAQAWLQNPGHDDKELLDLTHLPFVTIDNADSRDLDQALYIEKHIEDSNSAQLHIYYALADASYYVQPGSAIFTEAVRRAVTYYVPGLAVPMLPRALSEDLVSLNPGVVRRALLFKITLDPSGETIDTTVSRVRIKSRAKLAYLKVQNLYDHLQNNKSHPYLDTSYGTSLLNLQEVGRLRIQHAQRRDVVDYNRSEPRVTLSSTPPAGFAIKLRQRCDCEKYNEQISLLCNMEGAKLLESLQRQQTTDRSIVQSIFRVHSPPLGKRLAELRRTIDQLCDVHGLDDNWRWQAGQPLADYLSDLPAQSVSPHSPITGAQSFDTPTSVPHTSGTAGSVTHSQQPGVDEFAIRTAIERMILLTNRASFFSNEPGPHHALGVQAYARFSSPMREIAGIFTHKELLEALKLERAHKNLHDEQLQESIVKAANASKRLQKELDHDFHLKAINHYFHTDLLLPLAERPLRQATIMGMRSGKIYVNIDGFGIDVKIYLDDLNKQFNTRYQVRGVTATPNSESSVSAAPVFKTGDRLHLRLLNHDPGNQRFVLSPVF